MLRYYAAARSAVYCFAFSAAVDTAANVTAAVIVTALCGSELRERPVPSLRKLFFPMPRVRYVPRQNLVCCLMCPQPQIFCARAVCAVPHRVSVPRSVRQCLRWFERSGGCLLCLRCFVLSRERRLCLLYPQGCGFRLLPCLPLRYFLRLLHLLPSLPRSLLFLHLRSPCPCPPPSLLQSLLRRG